MSRLRCLGLIVAGVLLPTVPAARARNPAVGPTGSRPVVGRHDLELPFAGNIFDAAAILRGARGLTEIEKRIINSPEFRNSPALQKLSRQGAPLEANLNDPSIRKLVEEYINNHPELTQDDERRRRITETLDWWKAESAGPKSASPDDHRAGQKGAENPTEPSAAESGSSDLSPLGKPEKPAADLSPGSSPDQGSGVQEEDPQFVEQLLQKLENLQRNNTLLRNSPAMQRMVERLGRQLSQGPGFRWDSDKKTLTGGLGRWWQSGSQGRAWSGGLPFAQWPWPSLPRVTLPRFAWSGHFPSVSMPHIAPHIAGSGPAIPDTGPMLLWLAVLIVLGLVLWKLRSWYAARGAGGQDNRWRLGPWPVDPAAVSTREELIRAFEYLSLLKLGRAARTWNHLELAAALGREAAPCRGAAGRLAAVYEQARYAPDYEAMPADALRAARHDLVLLAGIASS